MENNFRHNFRTRDELLALTHIKINFIIAKLDKYIYYDGLLINSESSDDFKGAYVNGYLKSKRVFVDTYINDDGEEEGVFFNYYECGEYCSRPDLSKYTELGPDGAGNKIYGEAYYLYQDFESYCTELEIPLISNDVGCFIHDLDDIENYEEPVNLEDSKLSSREFNSYSEKVYPPELQLAIDAYEQLCRGKDTLPLNKEIDAWLKEESKVRGIEHNDGGRTFSGISNKKATAITSIIKSK